MTSDAVIRAIEAAARQAFAMGLQSARDRGNAERLRGDAITYARELVLPMAKLLADEAREQGWLAGTAILRQDGMS